MNDESIFLKATQRPVALTFMMVEYLAKRKIELTGDQETSFGVVLKEACALCEFPEPSEEQMLYLMHRLNGTEEKYKKPQEQQEEPKRIKANRDFAGALAEWIEQMKPSEMCLWISDYDLTAAANLYTYVDIEDVKEMVSCKVAHEFQMAKVQMEATLFGFGGGYKKTPSENTHVYDLSGEGSEAEQAAAFAKLEEIGF